ncbi:MAG: putative DNA binding domain-containing protein [Gemmatimonadota bacterium]|nr:putative DNA binding domain-containing protein [Gemmatimonadota bacterium]
MTPPLLTSTELQTILSRGEGQFVEFKSTWDHGCTPRRPIGRRALRDKIADVVAAFANADGGLLLVGVDDDGTATGHGFPNHVVDGFFAVPDHRLAPAVACRTERLSFDCHEILAFEVPIAPEAVMIDGDGFPYRVGARIIREPQEVINDRKQAYRRVGYEQRFRPDASVADLDLDLAKSFLRDTPVGARPVREALVYYGLIQRDARDWRVTNAALLLFARRPALRWHPRAGLRVFRVAGTEMEYGRGRNVTQIGRADPPLASAISEIRELARHQIRRTERLTGLLFKDIPEYPDFAWQEALVNAVAHRDYEVQGRETEIWFFEDRLEVSSPGELLPPVTVDTLREGRRAHATRNPMLVRVLADTEIMRDEGEGIVRVFREMTDSFLHEPQFSSESGLFTIKLFNEPVYETANPDWRRVIRALPIADDQERVLIARPDGFTHEDYQRLNSVDEPEARDRVSDLVNKDIVVGIETDLSKPARFALAPALATARRVLEERIPKLREYYRDQPFLKNADYRTLFTVDRPTALSELRLLVHHGYLQVEGERRGTHYLPTDTLGE